MSEFNISIPGGQSKRLKTGGKYCPADILVTAGGGSVVPVEEKDVNFYDYDGTCLYAYTIAEAQALTELPPGPQHDGLVFDGWNWSLEQVTATIQPMDIGSMFVTDDGSTRLYIKLIDSNHLDITVNIYQTASNGTQIDWGDGSSVETMGGTGNVSATHRFPTPGEYLIRLVVVSGTIYIGHGSGGVGAISTSGHYSLALQKAEVGANVDRITSHGFSYNRQMRTLTTPRSITRIESNAFNTCLSLIWCTLPTLVANEYTYLFFSCTSLRGVSFARRDSDFPNRTLYGCSALERVVINNGITSLVSNAMNGCKSMNTIYLPATMVSFNANCLQNCESLLSVTANGDVTSIQASAFSGCLSVAYYDFTKCTAVPTLANANAFSGIPADCEIRVPASLRDEWAAATNWSTYASQIVGV